MFPRNWQGETFKTEFRRRVKAAETGIKEAWLNFNNLNNRLVKLENAVFGEQDEKVETK